MAASFLGTTSQIRKRLLQRLPHCKSIDLAVAFITSEWLEIFGDFGGVGRVICWLSSPNTNPYAVEQMLQCKKNFRVRHIRGMHAKVYLSKGADGFAIVGSANLSSTALSLNDTAGNIEAAFEVSDNKNISEVAAWFKDLWKSASAVKPEDLSAAKAAYDARPKVGKATGGKKQWNSLRAKWKPSARLKALANKVRSISLSALREESWGWQFVNGLDPAHLTRADLEKVVDSLAAWAKHRGKFAPVLDLPISQVRVAFSVAFDKSRPLKSRLELLKTDNKLAGFGLPAWTMILYWWSPADYPPLNIRTKKFLRDMRLSTAVPVTVSPSSYEQWCAFCRELASRLKLPSAGHVDRMVWVHTQSMTYDELKE